MKSLVPVILFIVFLSGGCSFIPNSKTQKPEIHFSSNAMSLGVPNEILFLDNEYHIYYQCSQDSINHLGHATSTDLLHWQNMPLALSSDSLESIGSCSVIVDWNNISGVGSNNSPMIAFYSYVDNEDHNTRQDYHSIACAYSNDKGTTWEKSINKPVVLDNIPGNIKDLKVIWHEETQRWIMIVLTEYHIRLYSSVDLFNWHYENRIDDDTHFKNSNWEHLSFFPIDVEGSSQQKWVLMISVDGGSPTKGSGVQYFIGDFDGYSFSLSETGSKWLDNGSDNYAGVVLSNHLDFGKPLNYIASISNVRYKKIKDKDSLQYSDSYTIPRNLTLIKKYSDYFLISEPTETVKGKEYPIAGAEFSGELKLNGTPNDPLEVNLLFDVNNKMAQDFSQSFGIQLSNSNGDKLTIGYYNERLSFFISEQKIGYAWNDIYFAPYIIDKSEMDFKIIIDKSSVELFAINGMITLTKKYTISDDWNKISLFSEGGTIKLKEGSLKSIKRIR